MAIKTYSTNIPGNYITNWMNLFAKKVETKDYQRLPYNKWRDLKNLSNANKIKITIEHEDSQLKHIAFYYPVNAEQPYTQSYGVHDKSFGLFLNDVFHNKYICPFPTDWEGHDLKNVMTISTAVDGITTYTTDAGTSYTYNTSTVDWNTATVAQPITIDYGYDISKITNEIKNINNKIDELKKGDTMATATTVNNNMFNFDFGPVYDNKIRMSMYGYAIPNEIGNYVSYDIEHERMMDVQILNFDCANMFYKIPKPLNKIEPGDVVFHNGIPMFVTDTYDDLTRLIVIDPKEGTEKTILPNHSPFGFDYITTLVSLFDNINMEANSDNPFGNMLPWIMMNNGKTTDQTLPLMLMMNGNMDFNNPLMLLAMSNNNLDTNNPLLPMAMMKMFDK